MRRFKTTTSLPKNGTNTDPAVYAATYWRSALRMATLRALVVLAAITAAGASAGAVLLIEQVPAAAAGLGIVAVVIGVFAVSLSRYTTAVAQATWYRLEEQLAEDLDDDGYVGDPVRNVKIGGKQPTEITLDLPAASVSRAPILRPFGVSAPDLVSFLFEAQHSRGLQERQWIGKSIRAHVLPSGQQVTLAMFRQLLAECSRVGWAAKTANRWELTVDPEEVAKRLQAQMQPPQSSSASGRKPSFSRQKP